MAPRTRRLLARETLVAVLVLALAFLNFGHTSAAFAANGRVVVSEPSVCGDPATPNAADHFACHACRPDNAALPPPPCEIVPVVFATVAVSYAEWLAPLELVPVPRSANPRAPPVLI